MYEKDFEDMHFILKNLTISDKVRKGCYEYWQKRVNGRIKALTPLIKEVKEKNINLFELSPELSQEWIDLHDVKLFYYF